MRSGNSRNARPADSAPDSMTDQLAPPAEQRPDVANSEPAGAARNSSRASSLSTSRTTLWAVPTTLMLLSLLCMATIDGPIGHWIQLHPPIKPIRVFFEAAEHFGTPAGQFLLLLAVGWSALPAPAGNRKSQWDVRVPRIYVGALISGLAANVFKMCFTRTRPRAFAFEELNIWDGFGPFFPLGAGGASAQSFPSAHTACAVGFAVLLGWAWPERQRVFYLLAALVGLQRILCSAHFPSDVLAGAAVGWLTAQMYVRDCLVSRWWLRLEQRLDRWLRSSAS